MKIAIIGAGVTGLTAGYRLFKLGHRVALFEKENFCGGLAAGFRETDWDWSLENFYHHLFTSDHDIINLIKELCLEDKLFFSKPKTSIYIDKKIFEFDSPFSLLRFSPLPLSDRLRTGLVTLYLKTLNNWQKLEQITAYDWLQRYYGKRVFQVLWEPLLTGKFGKEAATIPMSWFWARIKKRSRDLAYLEGGFQVLIDKLVEEIKKNNGKIYLKTDFTLINFERVTRAEGVPSSERSPQTSTSDGTSKRQDPRVLKSFDKIIVTTSPQIFFPNLPAPKMLGALNLILILKQQFLTDGTYWLNINDSGFPFVAVVEHTNFIDKTHYGNNHILYVGGYYPQNHRYFQMSKKQILAEFLPFLQKINPLSLVTVIHSTVARNRWAQPVFPLNYSRQIQPHLLQAQRFTKRSPAPDGAGRSDSPFPPPFPTVYLANMSQVYPWDRGTNYAVELGEKIAKIVL